MIKQLLPIGSVVTLKDGKKKLMVIGVFTNDASTGKLYDYFGIPYPEGFINAETMFLFMHEDIEAIHFLGFVDAEFQAFRAALNKDIEGSNESARVEGPGN